MTQQPRSCDTFVVLPPLTKDGSVIFGKNSDRPQHEVQEVVYIKGGCRDSKIKCTYITIDESPTSVNSVILSKPAWMWGAEMGANDKNVVIGNEAVWTNNNEGENDSRQRRLLGMDLVRLGLERGDSAEEALYVITSLLEKYGQGGSCSEFDDSLFYHNSFLIADTRDAWVLETSGKLWVAEKVVTGYRNISNGLTIGTKYDKCTEGLLEKVQGSTMWDGESEFNFTECFSSGGDDARQKAGSKLLEDLTKSPTFDARSMFKVLRHKESRICRGCDDAFPTQGSQVSCLRSGGLSVHWFTATPDPSLSYFKPFVFTPKVEISPYTASPDEPKREHELYKLHSKHVLKSNNENISKVLAGIEEECLNEVDTLVRNYEDNWSLDKVDQLMKGCVDTEVKLYGGVGEC